MFAIRFVLFLSLCVNTFLIVSVNDVAIWDTTSRVCKSFGLGLFGLTFIRLATDFSIPFTNSCSCVSPFCPPIKLLLLYLISPDLSWDDETLIPLLYWDDPSC
jgi:hypothetical protein